MFPGVSTQKLTQQWPNEARPYLELAAELRSVPRTHPPHCLAGMEPARVKGLQRLAAKFQRATKDKQCVSGWSSSKEPLRGRQVRLRVKPALQWGAPGYASAVRPADE